MKIISLITLALMLSIVISKSSKRINVCNLPKVIGPCRGLFQRYYYNTVSKKCEQFNYGGCQANLNNFETIEACKSACEKN